MIGTFWAFSTHNNIDWFNTNDNDTLVHFPMLSQLTIIQQQLFTHIVILHIKQRWIYVALLVLLLVILNALLSPAVSWNEATP